MESTKNSVSAGSIPPLFPGMELLEDDLVPLLRGEDEEREAAFFGAAFFVVVADFAMILFF